MRNYKKYFQKNNFIYGVSYKDCEPKYVRKFDDLELAEKWLDTEEYDFRYREFVSKTEAKKIERRI